MTPYVEITAPGSVRDPSEESLGGSVEIVSYHRVTARAGEPLTITLLASDLVGALGDSALRVRLETRNDPPFGVFLPYDDISPTSPTYFNDGGTQVPWTPGVVPYADGNSYFPDTTTDLLTYATFTPQIDGVVYFAEIDADPGGVMFDPIVVAVLRVEVLRARVAPLRQLQRDDRIRKGSSKQTSTRQGWKGTYL